MVVVMYDGLVQPKRVRTSFVSDLGNHMSTQAQPAAAKLFESSDDWELQFDVSTKDGQTKNAVLAYIRFECGRYRCI